MDFFLFRSCLGRRTQAVVGGVAPRPTTERSPTGGYQVDSQVHILDLEPRGFVKAADKVASLQDLSLRAATADAVAQAIGNAASTRDASEDREHSLGQNVPSYDYERVAPQCRPPLLNHIFTTMVVEHEAAMRRHAFEHRLPVGLDYGEHREAACGCPFDTARADLFSREFTERLDALLCDPAQVFTVLENLRTEPSQPLKSFNLGTWRKDLHQDAEPVGSLSTFTKDNANLRLSGDGGATLYARPEGAHDFTSAILTGEDLGKPPYYVEFDVTSPEKRFGLWPHIWLESAQRNRWQWQIILLDRLETKSKPDRLQVKVRKADTWSCDAESERTLDVAFVRTIENVDMSQRHRIGVAIGVHALQFYFDGRPLSSRVELPERHHLASPKDVLTPIISLTVQNPFNAYGSGLEHLRRETGSLNRFLVHRVAWSKSAPNAFDVAFMRSSSPPLEMFDEHAAAAEAIIANVATA